MNRQYYLWKQLPGEKSASALIMSSVLTCDLHAADKLLLNVLPSNLAATQYHNDINKHLTRKCKKEVQARRKKIKSMVNSIQQVDD